MLRAFLVQKNKRQLSLPLHRYSSDISSVMKAYITSNICSSSILMIVAKINSCMMRPPSTRSASEKSHDPTRGQPNDRYTDTIISTI